MSIPKEPRQVMINIMYLVLTAMLALNVSAEILGAFITLDNSIEESNHIVGNANQKLLTAIAQQADAYVQYKPFFEKSEKVKAISTQFFDYVENLKQELITASGGLDENNLPKGIKDKNTTTRLLINEGKGADLEKEVLKVRADLLNLIEEDANKKLLQQSIPLGISEVPASSDKKTWAEFSFYQMPVVAVLPLLTKLQNDIKITETAILNYFYNKISEDPIVLDAYEAVVAADKGYVIRGDEYTAQLFLGAYSSTADNIFVKVDGRNYPVRNGKATFKIKPNTIGKKEHDLVIGIRNPVSHEVKTYRKKIQYEVGERSVTISADKMNVFYVGVENPISISAAGIPSAQMRIRAEGVKIQKQSNGKYIVKPKRTGRASITVSGGGLPATTFDYRIKAIPNPTIKLGNKTSGTISAAEMKIYNKLSPVLENFDFDARCKVVSFETTRAPKNDDPKFATNSGGTFNAATKRLTKQARRGDVYYFDQIKVRCPGDSNSRKLNGLIFKIR